MTITIMASPDVNINVTTFITTRHDMLDAEEERHEETPPTRYTKQQCKSSVTTMQQQCNNIVTAV
jgi:hypothetical protein